jgi:ADP-ribosylglycohydrolase
MGKVGLTFAPGKKQSDAATGSWDRDLTADLARLRGEFQVDHLVCLLEDDELRTRAIEGLPEAAVAAGIDFHRLPSPDFGVPGDSVELARMVSHILGWAAAKQNVVIHCMGGLGRAGTVGGCVLRAAGMDGATALTELLASRGPNCPETRQQRMCIEAFVPGPPAPRSRVLGAVLAAAIGDALGHPTEFLSAEAIRSRYGATGVEGFELWWARGGSHFAPYTDDTQMAEIVLRTFADKGAPSTEMDSLMSEIAAGFVHWANDPQGGHRAPGNACMAGARRIEAGVHWREAGGADAGGCGSVMRAYPFGLIFSDDAGKAERWAVEHSRMTHRHPWAFAACAAMAAGVAGEMRGDPPAAVFASMVEAAARHDAGTARMADLALADAAAGIEPEAALNRLEGWRADEAICAAMFVVARHERDLPGALLEGANAHGDSDSIATLAGALLGARLGLEALPANWVRDIERSDELLALAERAADSLGLD